MALGAQVPYNSYYVKREEVDQMACKNAYVINDPCLDTYTSQVSKESW